MKIQNKLFLVFFNTKENRKWDSWKKFAAKNNYSFSTLSDPLDRPVIRGHLNGKPISVEAVYEANPQTGMYLQIKAPVHNPRDFYFLVQDKKAYKSTSGIFDKSIHGICENLDLEEKFYLKSNSERLSTQILNRQSLSCNLLAQNNFAIELIDYELILTSYHTVEINKEFIELLKLFYSFLLAFEEISLDAIMNRE
ncbi:MAG TPA: hypothetical protein PLX69_00970 [Leptospiraceae bacterium]|nr:hypothetical protein [Leptospiraceae bacterium]HRG73107.1 hypothetical protein [Leptospiraceae bacterium]